MFNIYRNNHVLRVKHCVAPSDEQRRVHYITLLKNTQN